MDKYRGPEMMRSYAWTSKVLVLLLCSLHQIVCEPIFQDQIMEAALRETKKPEQSIQGLPSNVTQSMSSNSTQSISSNANQSMSSNTNQSTPLVRNPNMISDRNPNMISDRSQNMISNVTRSMFSDPSKQFMSRYINKDECFYQQIDCDKPKEERKKPTSEKHSILTVFDISEFQKESDIPEPITVIYQHDTVKITGNPKKETKSPAHQHAILKKLYKALRFQIICKLIVSNLYTFENSQRNNGEFLHARKTVTHPNEELHELILDHTSFQTAQWINIYFSYRNMQKLTIITENQEMLGILDYAPISYLGILWIIYQPDPNTRNSRNAAITNTPIVLSINSFILESTVPISLPTKMFRKVQGTIQIPYVVFKVNDFNNMESSNVNHLHIRDTPFDEFINLIGNEKNKIFRRDLMSRLKEISISVNSNGRSLFKPTLSDVIKVLRWAASLNIEIRAIKLDNVSATDNCLSALWANPEIILSITPDMRELNIGAESFKFRLVLIPKQTVDSLREVTPVGANSTMVTPVGANSTVVMPVRAANSTVVMPIRTANSTMVTPVRNANSTVAPLTTANPITAILPVSTTPTIPSNTTN